MMIDERNDHQRCNECFSFPSLIIVLGEENRRKVALCSDCLFKAVELLATYTRDNPNAAASKTT